VCMCGVGLTKYDY